MTLGDVLSLDGSDQIAKEFIERLRNYEFDYKMETKTKSRIRIFSPEFLLKSRTIYEFCHLPCCGASMNAIKVGLDVIINGLVNGESRNICIIDPRAKLDSQRLEEYIDEFIDDAGIMIDVEAILKNIQLKNFSDRAFGKKGELCDGFLNALVQLERGNVHPYPDLIIIDDITYPIHCVESADYSLKKTYFCLVSKLMRSIIAKFSTSIIYLRCAVTKVLGDGSFYYQPQYFGMWQGEFHTNMMFSRRHYELTSVIQTNSEG